jgi:hypothetical protein
MYNTQLVTWSELWRKYVSGLPNMLKNYICCYLLGLESLSMYVMFSCPNQVFLSSSIEKLIYLNCNYISVTFIKNGIDLLTLLILICIEQSQLSLVSTFLLFGELLTLLICIKQCQLSLVSTFYYLVKILTQVHTMSDLYLKNRQIQILNVCIIIFLISQHWRLFVFYTHMTCYKSRLFF